MESKVQKMKKSTDVAEENDGVTAEKIKFPLYVFPETMKTVDILYIGELCSFDVIVLAALTPKL